MKTTVVTIVLSALFLGIGSANAEIQSYSAEFALQTTDSYVQISNSTDYKTLFKSGADNFTGMTWTGTARCYPEGLRIGNMQQSGCLQFKLSDGCHGVPVKIEATIKNDHRSVLNNLLTVSIDGVPVNLSTTSDDFVKYEIDCRGDAFWDCLEIKMEKGSAALYDFVYVKDVTVYYDNWGQILVSTPDGRDIEPNSHYNIYSGAEQLNVVARKADSMKYTIYDIQDNIIDSGDIEGDEFTLTTPEDTGIYFVEISAEHGDETRTHNFALNVSGNEFGDAPREVVTFGQPDEENGGLKAKDWAVYTDSTYDENTKEYTADFTWEADSGLGFIVKSISNNPGSLFHKPYEYKSELKSGLVFTEALSDKPNRLEVYAPENRKFNAIVAYVWIEAGNWLVPTIDGEELEMEVIPTSTQGKERVKANISESYVKCTKRYKVPQSSYIIRGYDTDTQLHHSNFYINKVEMYFDNVPTRVEEVQTVRPTAEPVYYNLQGMRVANPIHGLYIRVADGRSEKILIN